MGNLDKVPFYVDLGGGGGGGGRAGAVAVAGAAAATALAGGLPAKQLGLVLGLGWMLLWWWGGGGWQLKQWRKRRRWRQCHR